MMAGQGIEQRLAQGVVLGAEGYVFELERRGYIKAGPYVPEVVLDAPEALRELHREFLRAGAEVMVALTYYAHRGKLRQVGRESDLEAMNRQAVRLAREVAAEGGALVAGNVCNTWAYDPQDAATAGVVRKMYAEQLGWAADEGIDFVIAETNDYLGEALIALEVSQELGLPAMVTMATTGPEKIVYFASAVKVFKVFPSRPMVCAMVPSLTKRFATAMPSVKEPPAVSRRSSTSFRVSPMFDKPLNCQISSSERNFSPVIKKFLFNIPNFPGNDFFQSLDRQFIKNH